jgi:hypothetical protein
MDGRGYSNQVVYYELVAKDRENRYVQGRRLSTRKRILFVSE